jgi:uncharacterized membrane protein YfcA
MVEFFPVIAAALLGSFLSFFCGFGLGTLLLPAFLLFFPLEIAVAASAVVHMLNNLFKLVLVGKNADWSIIKTFGLASVVGSVLGAIFLGFISNTSSLGQYTVYGSTFQITLINLIIGILIIVFSMMEILPQFRSIVIPRKVLPLGGLVSGFFGGLSGHQGALRSAFLMKSGLTKDAFVGTRVVCACLVDLSRITVYVSQIKSGWSQVNPWLVGIASLAAFTGAWTGNHFMKKTELRILNFVISVSLILFGIALSLGLVIRS